MKNLNLDAIDKVYKKNYLVLVVAIIMLIGSGFLFYFGYEKAHEEILDAKSMNSLITSNESKENEHAYIDVNMVPFLFATYETDGVENEAKFYLTMDKDNFLYIVYMDDEQFSKLDKTDIADKTIRIIGTTRIITEDIKELAISSYNEELQDDYLNGENFDEYVGTIFLDVYTPINDPSLLYILATVLLIVVITLVISFIINMLRLRKIDKQYSKEELEQIASEIYSNKETPYAVMKLYLTKNYVVDLSKRVIILKYEEIIWAYSYEYRYNGLVVNKCVRLQTKNGKLYDIANSKYISKNKDAMLEKVLKELKKRNKNILIGFNKENKKTSQELIKKHQSEQKIIDNK